MFTNSSIVFMALGAFLLSAFQQEQPGQGPPASGTSGIPPTELWSHGATELRLDSQNYAEVFARTDTKTVFCSWINLPSPPGAEGKTSVEKQYSLTYWPTDVSGDGSLGLYVGGRRPNGRTVIEKWTFLPPSSTPVGATLLERGVVQTLFNSDTVGRKDVVQIAPMPLSSEKVLVLFNDSRDLWVLDVVSGGWTKAASPTDQSVLVVPGLSEEWQGLSVSKHLSVGTMYVLSGVRKDYTLTVVDADNNGVMDSSMILTTEEWTAQGYSNPANYVN